MIINLRGTSGSGKTTLINAIMGLCGDTKSPIIVDGRKQPLGYTLRLPGGHPLFIPGHYESPCGGCDTLGKYIPGLVEPRVFPGDEAKEPNSYHLSFGLVRKYHALGHHVLFEGLLISGDVRHTKALHDDGLPVTVVAFDLPVEVCLDSVRARRAAAGNEKEFNEKNTRDKHVLLGRCVEKLKTAGVPVKTGDREQCLAHVGELLGIIA